MSKWGFSTATSSSGTAGTATGTVLAANTNRRYVLVRNDSDAAIYLGLGGAAALNAGIRLNPAGSADSSFEMSRGKANIHTGAVEAISSAGNKLVTIVEGE